jgi:hypothetical protein
MILRSSATPDDTALTDSKAAPDICARMMASDVLPLPGGPQRISEGSLSASSARRRMLSGPTTWSWPANSSRLRGLIRAASGAPPAGVEAAPDAVPPKRSASCSVMRQAYAAETAPTAEVTLSDSSRTVVPVPESCPRRSPA